MRYLVASLLTPQSDYDVRKAYNQAFDTKCRIKTLHLTFVPPFITPNPHHILNSLHDTQLPQTRYSTGKPGIFVRSRNILYYSVAPVGPLKLYFDNILPQIRPIITFESTDFPKDQIPSFLPHITLDYNFPNPIHWSLPKLSIELVKPALLLEQSPGIWKPYVI